ncbi:MAG: penicillin acylase family protein [Blastocatellia bacterium]
MFLFIVVCASPDDWHVQTVKAQATPDNLRLAGLQARVTAGGNRDTFIDNLIATWPRQWLPKEFNSWKDLLIACENEARENLTKRLGADETKWTFGNLTQIRFNHPLANAPNIGNQFKIDSLPQRGSGSSGVGATPNVGPAVSMRLIVAPVGETVRLVIKSLSIRARFLRRVATP